MEEKFQMDNKKYCSSCGILKEIEKDFYKNKGQCINCIKKYEKNKRLKKEVKIKNEHDEFKDLLNKIIKDIGDVKCEINNIKKNINRTKTFIPT